MAPNGSDVPAEKNEQSVSDSGEKNSGESSGEVRLGHQVVADEFLLRDSKGRIRAILRVEDDAPALTLVDSKGKPRIVLRAEDDLPGVLLLDSAGAIRAAIGVEEWGRAPTLHLKDADGNIVFQAP